MLLDHVYSAFFFFGPQGFDGPQGLAERFFGPQGFDGPQGLAFLVCFLASPAGSAGLLSWAIAAGAAMPAEIAKAMAAILWFVFFMNGFLF
jgi:hypothetical protein